MKNKNTSRRGAEDAEKGAKNKIMKKMMAIIASICLATSLIAQDEEASPFSARPVEMRIVSEFPSEVYRSSNNLNLNNGYVFMYIIEGENLVNIGEPFAVTKLHMKDGTDISTTHEGKPTYHLGYLQGIYGDGKYAAFYVLVDFDKPTFTEVPTLEGTITLEAAEGMYTETVTIKTDDKQPHVVGEYEVSLSTESFFEPFVVNVVGENVARAKNAVASVEVIADGQRLGSRGGKSAYSRSLVEPTDFSASYRFEKPSTTEVTINLTLWKNLKEHTVSF